MLSIIYSFLKTFKEVFAPLFSFFVAYTSGKKAEKIKYQEKQIEKVNKRNEIEETNSRKSDIDIVNELRERDTRGPN